MKRCSKCNLDFPDTNRNCTNCGGQLPDASARAAKTEGCPSCGAETKAGWKFCIACSTELPHIPPEPISDVGLSCQRCGNVNEVGVKFCTKCGNQLVAQANNQTQMLGSIASTASQGPSSHSPYSQSPQNQIPSLPAQAPSGQAQPGSPQPPQAWAAAPPCRNCGTAIPAGMNRCNVCGTPVAFYQPSAQAKKSSTTWIIVGVGAVLLAGLAIVIIAVLIYFSNRPSQIPTGPTVNPPPAARTSPAPATGVNPTPSTGSLTGLRVKLIYVARRSEDARRAADRLKQLGMVVIMYQISDSGNSEHMGKVYSTKQNEALAKRIADTISDIERVQFSEQTTSNTEGQQFNLWIAR